MALKKQTIRSNQLITENGEPAGIKYNVSLVERNDLDSNGNKPVKVPPLPGERTF